MKTIDDYSLAYIYIDLRSKQRIRNGVYVCVFIVMKAEERKKKNEEHVEKT